LLKTFVVDALQLQTAKLPIQLAIQLQSNVRPAVVMQTVLETLMEVLAFLLETAVVELALFLVALVTQMETNVSKLNQKYMELVFALLIATAPLIIKLAFQNVTVQLESVSNVTLINIALVIKDAPILTLV